MLDVDSILNSLILTKLVTNPINLLVIAQYNLQICWFD